MITTRACWRLALLVLLTCSAFLAAADPDAPELVRPAKPWRDQPQANHQPSDRPARTITGSFPVVGCMEANPTLTCTYIIPLGDDGRPLPSSSDMVLAIPYQDAKDPFLGRTQLATHYGFTLFGISFPSNGVRHDDEKRFFIYAESGSGRAWVKAQQQVREIGGFPDQSMFVVGLSAGGTAAQRFSEVYGDRVEGFVSWAGMSFTQQTSYRGPALFGSGMLDRFRNAAIDETTRRMAANGAHISRVLAVPPVAGDARLHPERIEHTLPSGDSEMLVYAWIGECADLRRRNRGKLPDLPPTDPEHPGSWFPGKVSAELAKKVSLDFTKAAEFDDGFGNVDQLIHVAPRQPEAAGDLVVLISHNPLDDQLQQCFDIYLHSEAGRAVIAILDPSRKSGERLLAALQRLPRRAFGKSGRVVVLVDKHHKANAQLIAAIPAGRRVVIYQDLTGDDRWVDLNAYRGTGRDPLLLATQRQHIERFDAERFLVKNGIEGWMVPDLELPSATVAHVFSFRVVETAFKEMGDAARKPIAAGGLVIPLK